MNPVINQDRNFLPENFVIVIVIGILALVAMIFGVCNAIGVSSLKDSIAGISASENDLATKINALKTPSPLPTAKPAATIPEDQLKMATGGNGEGVERTIIRQLEADPGLAKYIPYSGDRNNKAALKEWAGGEAHRMAIGAGYFDLKFGGSVGAKRAGTVAYVLTKRADGSTDVSEYLVASPNQPQHIRMMTEDLSKAQFLGTPGSNDKPASLPFYETMQE